MVVLEDSVVSLEDGMMLLGEESGVVVAGH